MKWKVLFCVFVTENTTKKEITRRTRNKTKSHKKLVRQRVKVAFGYASFVWTLACISQVQTRRGREGESRDGLKRQITSRRKGEKSTWESGLQQHRRLLRLWCVYFSSHAKLITQPKKAASERRRTRRGKKGRKRSRRVGGEI